MPGQRFPPVFIGTSPEPGLKIATLAWSPEFAVVVGQDCSTATAGCKPELSAATALSCLRPAANFG